MFQRIAVSWQLVKASAAILRSDEGLIVFPIVSTVALVLVTAAFAVPLWVSGAVMQLPALRTNGVNTLSIAWVLLLFLFYIIQYFIMFFANSALIGAVMMRLRGGRGSVGDGFNIALQHVPQIFGYAVISATVGMILRAISERGTIGRIVASILNFGWNVTTYLVVPVLVVENVGPIEAIKRSGNLLKRTWGEQIVGNFGIGAVFGLITLPIMLIGFVLFGAAMSANAALLALGVIVLMVIALLVVSLIGSALRGIYQAVVYQYAATGQVDGRFDPTLVRGAFRPKRQRSLVY